MAQKSLEDITEEAVQKGGIFATLHFDVFNNEKENLQSMLVDFIGRIGQDQGVIYVVGEVMEVIQIEDGYSTSAEVKIVTKDFASLTAVAMRYAPIGVEVVKPNSITLTAGQVQDILLGVADTSQEFTQFALKKLLSPEEREAFERKMKARAELGKRLLGKSE